MSRKPFTCMFHNEPPELSAGSVYNLGRVRWPMAYGDDLESKRFENNSLFGGNVGSGLTYMPCLAKDLAGSS